ncbi:MAG: hypothetical protein CO137_00970 [Candidatus Magasanikbacteria bacterium CG_4_9_14_3_um_filter_32_9]|uniref:HAD family phosphatase n=1 Tax=Candidatus Magasanikbacteria bacterium CG_4_9_14_3_um_filter_32_9 TaxID=1974644 RepID=A0A2M7Z7E0_9BACT|nr:MAG: hypothetical protein CO137_00970 [Candidatus Magasanikbacteria bacterium CG_4_9_14_3_um_filter_32_9]
MKTQRKFEAIIFDIGNVLLETSFAKTDEAMAKLTDLSVEELTKTVFTSPEAREMWRKSQVGETNLEEFCNEVLGLLGVSKKEIDHEKLKQTLTSSGCENPHIWELLEVFVEVNPKIKRAIISNNTPLYKESGQRLTPKLYTFFSPKNIIMSHEVGMMKPDPAIFTFTSQKIGVAIANSILIDDNTENVERFREMGGVTIQYDCSKNTIMFLWKELHKLGLM